MMDKEDLISYGDDYHYIPMSSVSSGTGVEVLPDLYCYTTQISNIALVGDPETANSILIDAGMPGSANKIITATEKRFGADARPQAILLTHGHFDHVGAVIDLVKHWDVPVYAHELELPFLTGKESYPKPDSTVEGGMIAKISPMFPIEPIDLGDYVHALPNDGTVPHIEGFRYVHTPGHTVGHVSFFRDSDRTLIAGDVFTSVKQDSLTKVITQAFEIQGPPRYLTPDWQAAWESVKKVRALNPAVAITGHGIPIEGEKLTESLKILDEEFDKIAIPDFGKFVQ